MKMTKRIFAVLMAVAILMLCGVTAFADGEASLTVTGDQITGKHVDAIRMFSVSWVDNNGNNQIGPLDTISYTLESAWEGFFTDTLLGSTAGATRSEKAFNYLKDLENDSTELIAFADLAAEYARNHAADLAELTTRESADESETSVVFANLTPGYYLVLPEGGSTSVTRHTDAMLVNVPSAKATNLELKSVYPTVEKTVDGKKATSAQIGDTVTFTLTSAVPEMGDYDTYVFNFIDTMSAGLQYVADSAEVTIGEESVRDGDYAVTYAENILTIAFADLKTTKTVNGENVESAITAGAPIVVTYDALITENAVINSTGNLNQAFVEYSNNPVSAGTGQSLPSDSTVYTYPIEIHKYHDSDVAASRLSGAVFELKASNAADAPAISLIKVTDATNDRHYRLAKDNETDSVTQVTTDLNGLITIDGLAAGTYYLYEIAAPTGYNKLSAPITITIAPTVTGTGSNAVSDYSIPKYTVGSAAPSNSDVVAVENRAGSVLPSTGSFGTIGLTIAGVAIVILGVVFTSRKKKSAKAE